MRRIFWSGCAVVLWTLAACGAPVGVPSWPDEPPGAVPEGRPSTPPPRISAPALPLLEPLPPARHPVPGGFASSHPRPQWPELQKTVPHWSLDIAANDLPTLDATTDTYVPATLTVDGRAYKAEARYHGRSSRDFPKKSFNVKLGDGLDLDGRKHFILLAMYQDAGYLTEKLFWDLFAAAGVPASKARYIELTLNGQPYGVMLDVERVDSRFLAGHGFDPDSDVFRCGQKDCEMRDRPPAPWQEGWSKETNEKTGDANLKAFLSLLNHTSEDRLESALEQTFEIDAFARFLAVDAAISTYTTEDSRSYLVQDATTHKWTYVPWDLNNSLAMYLRRNDLNHTPITNRELFDFTAYDPWAWRVAADRSLPPAWSVLNTRFVDRPALLARFGDELGWLLSTVFVDSTLAARIDTMDALLKPYRDRDPWIDPAYAAKAAGYLKRYVAGRRDWLLKHAPELRAHGQSGLKVDRVTPDGAGGLTVELMNPDGKDAALEGFTLSADLKRPPALALSGRTVPAHGTLRLEHLPQSTLNFDPAHPAIGLFGPDGQLPVDLLFLPPIPAGRAYGRVPSGSEEIRLQ